MGKKRPRRQAMREAVYLPADIVLMACMVVWAIGALAGAW